MRVRNFVQDDGHIFCSEAQIQSEVSTFIDLTFGVYQHFGFENIDIKLSTRPEKRTIARCNITGVCLDPSSAINCASKRSGMEKSTCKVPHCHSLSKQSLSTNSIFGP
jgi:threonyl-tRNA synthetase